VVVKLSYDSAVFLGMNGYDILAVLCAMKNFQTRKWRDRIVFKEMGVRVL